MSKWLLRHWGELKDEFIRMCSDCIAVKTQLLR